jgi:hypothetical protein
MNCLLRAILLLWSVRAFASDSLQLPQDAYVWQRAWTESVTNAVATLASDFGELVVLQAEVTWQRGAPQCTRVDLDYSALRSTGRAVGLALRIGSFPGPFTEENSQTRYLSTLAQSLLDEAVANELQPVELQLDFDCAESKLDGYLVWLAAIQRAVRPVPVTLTALPSWLGHSEFKELVEVADGYVLQVHSFERPRNPNTKLTLCDPGAAKQAVAEAVAIGRPFRVALPTYGYLAAFNPDGQFIGLSAEGPARNWPATAQVIEVQANPNELSRLVHEWSTNRPPTLLGVIWYRLPVAGDAMNWTWATLEAVMAGAEPRSNVQAMIRRVQPGLIEVDLVNSGAADATGVFSVIVRWVNTRRIAADGIHAYQVQYPGPAAAQFQLAGGEDKLRAQERKTIGWIRFDGDPEVKAELHERQE